MSFSTPATPQATLQSMSPLSKYQDRFNKLNKGCKTHGSTSVKRKASAMVNDVVEATRKGSQALVDSIDQIQETSVEIEEKRLDTNERYLQQQLDYFAKQDASHQRTVKNLVKVLSTLTIAMCHAYVVKSQGAHYPFLGSGLGLGKRILIYFNSTSPKVSNNSQSIQALSVITLNI